MKLAETATGARVNCNIINRFKFPVHRDIKPGNILLVGDKKGNMVAKLADFGLSKKLTSSHTPLTTNKGTLDWMAPEVRISGGQSGTVSTEVTIFCISFHGMLNSDNSSTKSRMPAFEDRVYLFDFRPTRIKKSCSRLTRAAARRRTCRAWLGGNIYWPAYLNMTS